MNQSISESEIARAMDDQAARLDGLGRLQRRNFLIQQIFSQIQGLADEDFESACSAFSSIITTFESRRTKKEEDKARLNSKSKDIIHEVNRKANQNRGTTI